ncbi:ribonuclease P/MRP protein subunit POP7 SCDLUD_002066 [Saccharomycodes ludwigii]|uniref:ribonuclease P/MRP protein subunit POP7 n=1 Tax=Saccharomycodes ludwigii TaxID=36035 RepID=UPI001E87E5AB|nr:hypothetical protein SCDLUD_002066 [Saccharomycodes ludwigii]KAH3902249.1 hypothetical protein SCDLUD_002066 [Saccharomycodes ludwigii]
MIKNIKKKNLQDFVTVVGMGKAVGKALAIIAYYKLNYKTEISTTTVTVLDTYTSFSNNQDIVNDDFSDSENETVNIKKRLISGVQIRIYI